MAYSFGGTASKAINRLSKSDPLNDLRGLGDNISSYTKDKVYPFVTDPNNIKTMDKPVSVQGDYATYSPFGNAFQGIEEKGGTTMLGGPAPVTTDPTADALALPEYTSIRNEEGGLLPGFEYTPEQYDIQKMLGWYDPAVTSTKLRGQTNLDAATKQAATERAMAESNLAMRGGLRSGASERLGQESMDQALMAKAGLRGQTAQDLLGLQTERGLQESQILGANTDLLNQAEAYNLQNILGDVQGERDYDITKYTEANKKHAAEQIAKAIAASGGGGGGFDFGEWLSNPLNFGSK